MTLLKNTNPIFFFTIFPKLLTWWKRFFVKRFLTNVQRDFLPRTLLLYASIILFNLPSFVAQGQVSISWRELVWNDVFDSFDPSRFFIGTNTTYSVSTQNVILNPYLAGQAGRLVLLQPRLLDYYDASFLAYFGVMKTENGGGADGIVFSTGRQCAYPVNYGGELNFNGCNGFGIELDTYRNPEMNDVSEAHIALIETTSNNHLHMELLTATEIKDGRWHAIRISNRDGTVKVFFDGTDRFTYTIPGYLPYIGYFGFTSATGTSYNDHAIDNVVVSTPSRLRRELGLFSTCDTQQVSTSIHIRNNHPDQTALLFQSIQFDELDGIGEFSFTPPVIPLSLTFLDSLMIPFTFRGQTDGIHRAVIRMQASNGERIADTLSLQLATPHTRWSRDSLMLPRTHIGASSEQTIFLRNIGLVSATVSSFRDLLGSPFRIVQPTVFPITIAPGDSLAVLVRFSPVIDSTYVQQLQVENSCGIFPALSLYGTGFVSTLHFHFQKPALMLQPEKQGILPLTLDDNPTGLAVQYIDADFSWNAAIADFVNASLVPNVWPAGTTLQVTPVATGRMHLEVHAPSELRSNGILIACTFSASTRDTGCTEVSDETFVLNQSGPFPGVPRAELESGKICINNSCRVPDGVTLLGTTKISISPHPVSDLLAIHLDGFPKGDVHVRVMDWSGMTVASVTETQVYEGSREIVLQISSLPAGMYLLLLQQDQNISSKSFILLR